MEFRAFLAVLAMAAACSPEDDEVGSTDAGCDFTSCTTQCLGAGFSAGSCQGGTCICQGSDGGTDAEVADVTEHPPYEGTAGECDVDILFVYDTSGSMMDAVGPLTTEAFPGFAEALSSTPTWARSASRSRPTSSANTPSTTAAWASRATAVWRRRSRRPCS